MTDENNLTGLEIAVIGMAGRFPGAGNINKFWENLKNGVETIGFFSQEELLQAGLDPGEFNQSNYIKAKGTLQRIEFFDADFFGYSPKEAEIMEPQVRIFYECVWHALEDAGYDPGTYKKLIGLYAGARSSFYWEARTLITGRNRDYGDFAASILNDKDYLSARISYRLNLRGPCYTIQTACSTSLAAIHLGCQGLLGAECDMALAGGISLAFSQRYGYRYQEGMIFSPDGHCRTFDARANGTVFGDGVGIVVLKRYEDALKDNDHIYALIKGSACNNDGIERIGFTAPGIEGQTAVIRSALRMAEVEPETIGYIEAHGTGTSLGDPIEIEALTRAFNTPKKNYCGMGSVKTNLGHLNTAAGVTGFIKTVLALKNKLIPPSLHFSQANPGIDFENSPFYVNTGLCQWKNNTYPCRAGVSSFGIGGTNAHVILEEAPPPVSVHPAIVINELLIFSARSETALDKIATNLANYLKPNSQIDLSDVAFTLQSGRKAFNHRRMLVCSSIEEAVRILPGSTSGKAKSFITREGEKPVIFMFPGQGSQYIDMGRELYQTDPVFKEEMDSCFKILKPLQGSDTKKILYPENNNNSIPPTPHTRTQSKVFAGGPGGQFFQKAPPWPPEAQINQTEIAQPLVFVIEYALAKILIKWGIEPRAMIGHSIGEYTAACLSGVISLEDALMVVSLRGQLMQKMPAGAMLSVGIGEEKLKLLLDENINKEISLAAVNGPENCVVSGPQQAVAVIEKQLKEQGFACRMLHTSHAYHSEMMEPILGAFEKQFRRIRSRLNSPKIPYISNLTGKWISNKETGNPGYWARHLRQTVRFSDGLQELFSFDDAIFMEVGPGSSLSTFVRNHPDKKSNQKVINTIRHPKEKAGDVPFLLSKIGECWLYGKDIDWSGLYPDKKRYRVPLPGYPFEGQRFRIEGSAGEVSGIDREIQAKARLDRKNNRADWFYIPQWTRSGHLSGPVLSPLLGLPSASSARFTWLVLMDECGLGAGLVGCLKEKRQEVVLVKEGAGFEGLDTDTTGYQIHPGNSHDYQALFEELSQAGKLPDRILHLWGVTGKRENRAGNFAELIERDFNNGFYSLLYLAQAIGKRNISRQVRIEVVTDHMQGVTGEETLCPGKAGVTAVLKCIRAEYPGIECRSIDIVLPEPGTGENHAFIRRLSAVLESAGSDSEMAFRGAHWWVRSFEPVKLQEASEPPALLKEKGVYLIAGGLGGIGLKLSEYLVKTVKARLILTGRSQFPARDQWQEWLDTHPKEDPNCLKINKLQEFENLGGEILVCSADVTIQANMRQVIDLAMKKWGQINGVVHAAGVPDGGIIQLRDPETIEPVLAPKVTGTLVLDEVLQDIGRPLDFIIYFSSLLSILGTGGQAAYAAANTFLDAYAYYRNLNNPARTYILSINWDAWLEVGMAAGASSSSQLPGDVDHDNREIASQGIFPGEGIEVFGRLLGSENRFFQVAVSVRDLNEMIRQVGSSKKTAAGALYQRPELSSQYAAPGDKLEEEIVNIWQEYFGIREVGIHDNFFELGGDSLKGMTFVNRYNQWLGEIVYINAVFEAPSPAELAAYFRKHYPEAVQRVSGTGPDRNTPDRGRRIDKALIEKISIMIPTPVPRGEETGQEIARNPSAIFILSPPRSGSTLLRVMLAGHPRLFAPPELGLLFFNTLDEIDFRLESLIRAVMQIKNCSVEEAKRILEEKRQQEITTRQFYLWLQEEMGEQILVDKTPNYALNPAVLRRVEQEFENPFYIHLLRHPYGMIRSYEEAKLDLIRGDRILEKLSLSRREYAELTWLINHQNINEFLKNIPVQRQYKVNFEDLVTCPGEVITGMCQFLGLEMHDDMLKPYKDKKQRMTDGIHSEGIMIGDVKFHRHRDINPAVADAWKQQVHEDFLSQPTREIAESFGYSCLQKKRKKAINTYRPTPLEWVEEKEYYPLSPAQMRLYILHGIGSDIGYNISTVLKLEGRLEIRELEAIFIQLINRQESFRTSFRLVKGEPVQRIQEAVEFEIEDRQIDKDEDETGKDSVKRHIRDFIRPFDLAQAPLLRIGLIESGDRQYLLVMDMHHIISDGGSMGIVIKDFAALCGDQELPQFPVRYKDYSHWQNSQKRQEMIKKQEQYWTELFPGDIPVLNLPADFARPSIQSFAGETYDFVTGREVSRALKDTALKEGGTFFMVILSILNILLWKLSGQEDIIVGIDMEGREYEPLRDIVGMFANTLAMRNFLEPGKTFREFFREVKHRTLNTFANRDYPFEELVEKVSVERDVSRNPVFDVLFSFMDLKAMEKNSGIKWERSDLKLKPYTYKNSTAKFDLTLIARERREGVTFTFEYCIKLFKKETIRRYAEYFKTIVSAVLADTDVRLSQIRIISEKEKKQILFEFNQTEAFLVRDKCYPQLFQSCVSGHPHGIAAVHNDNQVTYKELDAWSNQIADMLLKHGVKPGKHTALYLTRSIAMLAGILGIFKTGGAYIPLELDYPISRLEYILENSDAQVLITTGEHQEILQKTQSSSSSPKNHIVILNKSFCGGVQGGQFFQKAPPLAAGGKGNLESLAYIIYTSGTTGEPKGVMIHQLGMINHLYAKINDLGITGADIIAQTASVCFDISVWQFLAGLITGGSTCIINKEIVLEGQKLLRALQRNRVTILETVPSLMKAFLEGVADESENGLKRLRWMIPTGEALTVPLVREWYRRYPGIRLVNAYGPTEASDDVTHYKIHQMPAETETSIPIGRPLQNLHIYILDRGLSLCPPGIRGEICVSGIGVGKGYWRDEPKTAKAFIDNPYMKEIDNKDYQGLYKTGDIGYFDADGKIWCLGRMDYQVKIRGNRVELGEIESRLLSHREITGAVVVDRVKPAGDLYLCAYIVVKGPLSREEQAQDTEQGSGNTADMLTDSGLSEYLAQSLPTYMIPSYFVRMESLPLTPNGKIDRKSLPEPGLSGTSRKYIPPGDEIQEKVIRMWAEVLAIEKEKISLTDDFFRIGGNSLEAVKFVALAKKELNVEIPIAALFEKPLAKDISMFIKAAKYEEKPAVLLNPGVPAEKNLFCFPPGGAYGLVYREFASAIKNTSVYTCHFIEEEDRLEQYVRIITDIQPVGPYFILGYSAAGKLVFQVARALESQGFEIADIIVIDSLFRENVDEEKIKDKYNFFINAILERMEELGIGFLKERVKDKMQKYLKYNLGITKLDRVNANVQFIVAKETFQGKPENLHCWDKLTTKTVVVHQGFGDHISMFQPGSLEKNTALIQEILDKS